MPYPFLSSLSLIIRRATKKVLFICQYLLSVANYALLNGLFFQLALKVIWHFDKLDFIGTNRNKAVNQLSLRVHTSQVAHQATAYPGFCCKISTPPWMGC